MEPTRFVCQQNMCNGCMACMQTCHKHAITIRDELSVYYAVIDESQCINCRQCEQVCPRNNPVETTEPILWVQGWAKDQIVRENSSSGGYATAIMQAFISQDKGHVFSCSLKDGQFGFYKASDIQDCAKFRGSKYVKSNPADVYATVRSFLQKGEKVLFLGLPCQVAGMKNFLGKANQDNFYTVDLICHGTPSPQLLERYLAESHGICLNALEDISFRKKTGFNLTIGEKKLMSGNASDPYTIAFLEGLDYTENCYDCHYATTKRVSDISLGDSWGSCLSCKEQLDGISLALCQTEKGRQLLEMAGLELQDVDIVQAIKANRQLQEPTKMPRQRKMFFDHLSRGLSFEKAFFLCYPKLFFKQKLKKILLKFHMLK